MLNDILSLCIEKSGAENRIFYSFEYSPFFDKATVKKYEGNAMIDKITANANQVLEFMQDE